MVYSTVNCPGLNPILQIVNNSAGFESEEQGDIEVGVPQGSCLSPLPFLIYSNDLPHAFQGSNISMHADDTSLCYQSNDLTQLIKLVIMTSRNSTIGYMETNSLNVAKTCSILLVTKQNNLGVQIDSSLDWKEQIKAVSVKVSRALGFLKHAKNLLPWETLRTLYTGIVEPHFRYYCSVWGCAGSTEIKQLQVSESCCQNCYK